MRGEIGDDGRAILLDRGFVPQEARRIDRPPVRLQVTGNLHWPQDASSSTPAPNMDENIWFARDVPANGMKFIAANGLQNAGDQVINPKTVLPWLLTSQGAPGLAIALLVPIRESLSMLPQAALTPWIKRRAHRKSVWVLGSITQGVMALIMALSAAGPARTRAAQAEPDAAVSPLTQEATLVVQGRCGMCHAARPLWPGIHMPPKGVKLETTADLIAEARAIRTVAVLTHAMPPGNVTGITEEERETLARWAIEEGR